MRRSAVFALMISLLLLTGCGSKAQESAYEQFAQSFTGAGSVSYTADIRAEYADKSEEYTLKLVQSGDDCTVEVTKPDIITGVKAHVTKDGSKLSYDGAQLDTGPLNADGLTPVSALPTLNAAIKTGHLDMAWKEGDATVAQITPNDGLVVTVWFDENMIPYHAELQSSGKVVVYCDIIDFILK